MQYFVVDAFTDRAFRGNPAAVVILRQPLTDDQLQAIAAEFNLSETAFLHKQKTGVWRLRWFTPRVEIELCGHATLASAHVIWHELNEPGELLTFATMSGEWQVRRAASGSANTHLELEFPALVPEKTELPSSLIDSLQLEPLNMVQGGKKLLVELARATSVHKYKPPLTAIEALPQLGLIVTAKTSGREFLDGDTSVDFVSRYFAPKVGIAEDPVTGSAHCVLGPYWCAKLGKNQLLAKQISLRGGVLHLNVTSDRVRIGGCAVTVMAGSLRIIEN